MHYNIEQRKFILDKLYDFISLHYSRNLITYLDFKNELQKFKGKNLDEFFYPEHRGFLSDDLKHKFHNGITANFDHFCNLLFNDYYIYLIAIKKLYYNNLIWGGSEFFVDSNTTIGIGDCSVFDFSDKLYCDLINFYNSFSLKMDNVFDYSQILINDEVIKILKDMVVIPLSKNKILLGYSFEKKQEIISFGDKYKSASIFPSKVSYFIDKFGLEISQRHFLITSQEHFLNIQSYLFIKYCL